MSVRPSRLISLSSLALLGVARSGARASSAHGLRGVPPARTTVVVAPAPRAVVVAPAPPVVVGLPSGYIAVLPAGYRMVTVSGARYYYVGGIHYRATFYQGGPATRASDSKEDGGQGSGFRVR